VPQLQNFPSLDKTSEKRSQSIDNAAPATIWITGISASGKSTLATALYRDLAQAGIQNISVIDGESLRTSLEPAPGHRLTDRLQVLELIVQRAREAQEEGNLAIVSTISSRKSMRRYARKRLHPFMEVYLDCPVEVCAARDWKGHYRKAYLGAYELFVGVTEQYERSDHSELNINTGNLDIASSSQLLFDSVLDFLGKCHG
jgi:adenylylsulfate kinase